jgi:hypothetical protein
MHVGGELADGFLADRQLLDRFGLMVDGSVHGSCSFRLVD